MGLNPDEGEKGSKYLRDTSLEEEARNALQQAATDVGEPLSRSAYITWTENQDEDVPSHTNLPRQLGLNTQAWGDICATVGIRTPDNPRQRFTEDDLKTALQQAVSEVGEPLTQRAYETWRTNHTDDLPSVAQIRSRLNATWRAACKSLNITPGEYGGTEHYTDAEIASALQQAAEEIGEPLSYRDYKSWKNSQDRYVPGTTTIQRRLGDGRWADACANIGIETPTKPE